MISNHWIILCTLQSIMHVNSLISTYNIYCDNIFNFWFDSTTGQFTYNTFHNSLPLSIVYGLERFFILLSFFSRDTKSDFCRLWSPFSIYPIFAISSSDFKKTFDIWGIYRIEQNIETKELNIINSLIQQ